MTAYYIQYAIDTVFNHLFPYANVIAMWLHANADNVDCNMPIVLLNWLHTLLSVLSNTVIPLG